jgi:hypothetical protein
VRVSAGEIAAISNNLPGRTAADGRADVEALNRSRGGSGSATCPADPDQTSQVLWGCDQWLAYSEQVVAGFERQLRDLERKQIYWNAFELDYVSRLVRLNQLILFPDTLLLPAPPSSMDAIIDANHGKPAFHTTFREDGTIDYHGYEQDPATRKWINPSWDQTPEGQAAAKEKEDYNLKYSQQADRIEKARNARSAQDLGPYIVPELMLNQISQEQDQAMAGLKSANDDRVAILVQRDLGNDCRNNDGQQQPAPPAWQRGGSNFTP